MLWLPYAEWTYLHRIDLRLLAFAVGGAYLILKAIAPRRDRFDTPGPLLTPAAHPRLHALVDDVARATGQAPPAEVYLVPDVNAFVAERGGALGIGSRRVMGVGLPLLELLTVEELRAVVAHEFGHYVGGDTRLGPWIYKTRAAIGRTMHEVSGHSRWLAKPFAWYGAGFLRVTHAVSRAQEYVADATAARIAGRDAARRALVRLAGGAGAFGAYWSTELAPALGRGYRPPVAAGFRQFLAAPEVVPQVAAMVDRELAESATDPYDTHPSLRDRLAALDRLPSTAAAIATRPGDGAPATELLADVDAVESALLAGLARGAALAPIAWDAVPATVLPVGWRELVAPTAAGLAGLTPERLPEVAGDLAALAVRLGIVRSPSQAQEEHRGRADAVVGAAVALALLERVESGDALRLEAPPGEPVRFVLGATGATEIQPFAVRHRLAEGALGAEAWRAECEAAGIVGVDLGAVATRAAALVPARPRVR